MSEAIGDFVQKTVLVPTLPELLRVFKLDILRGLHVCMIGRIQSFDPIKATAKIQILSKRKIPDGDGGYELKPWPELADCPVYTAQGGGGSLTFPIAKDDQCLVVFSDRDLDAWFATGTDAEPFTARCHDLSDAIAIVGLNASNSAFLLMGYEADTVALKLMTDLGESAVRLKAGKIALENSTKSLLTLVENLLTIVKGINCGGNPVDPVSQAALDTLKTEFQTLLYTSTP